MSEKRVELEIVEYTDKEASVEELIAIFDQNYATMGNLNSFQGLRSHTKLRLGSFLADFIPFLTIALFWSLTYFLMSLFLASHWTVMAIFSLLMSVFITYMIYFKYLMGRLMTKHLNYGKNLRDNCRKIEERYFKSGGKFWIAKLHDLTTKTSTVVGHFGFVMDKPEDLKKKGLDEKLRNGHMEMLGVLPGYRGLGIANKMVDKAMAYAEEKKCESLTLWVLEINFAGRNLYKKYDFKVYTEFIYESLTRVKAFGMFKKLN